MTLTTGTISAQDLKAMRDRGDDMVLLNVLPEEKFATQHIPESENVPIDSPRFVQDVTDLAGNRHRHIVVYCGGGKESSDAATALREAGFTNVDHFSGGMREWNRMGYAVESGLHSTSRR